MDAWSESEAEVELLKSPNDALLLLSQQNQACETLGRLERFATSVATLTDLPMLSLDASCPIPAA